MIKSKSSVRSTGCAMVVAIFLSLNKNIALLNFDLHGK